MAKKLFLLDGMALVYRAHFALAARPIFTSKGVNTSALYGFTQNVLEIIKTSSRRTWQWLSTPKRRRNDR